jgi:signal transduction histidine kinase
MRRPARSDVTLPLVAAVIAWFLVRPGAGGPWVDLAFVAVLLTALLLLVRAAWRAHRESREQAARAREVAGRDPGAVAAAAVREERARMAAEIDATVRGSLQAMRREAQRVLAGADPVVGTRAVQAEARRAMTELRRQLGLLRDTPADRPETGARETGPSPDAGALHVSLRDVAWTLAAAALASGEALAGSETARSPTAVVLSLAFYLGLLAVRTAPLVAAAWMTGVLLLALVLDVRVVEGLVFATAYAAVLWRLVTRPAVPVATLAPPVLAGAVVGSRWLQAPDNVAVNLVVVVAVVATAALVRRSRRTAERARREAARGEEGLRAAALAAVAAERQAVARELHDVASHAVSLLAVQAGAAEVLWSEGRPDAVEATRQLVATADRALAELDTLRPGVAPPATTWSDVEAVVGRMRAAGLRVTLTRTGEVPAGLLPTVYRVVQESLTNALRHAPDAPARVEVAGTADRVEVTVRNDGSGPAPDRRGFGLVGLRERVAHTGGAVQAGPDPAGGFTVRATLPATRRVVGA